MARGSTRILDDDKEIDLLYSMLDICGLKSGEFIWDERILSKETFEDNLSTLLRLVEFESHNYNRSVFFVIGYLFLITGASLPANLKDQILYTANFDLHEKNMWINEEDVIDRKVYLKDFREKIQFLSLNPDTKLHTMNAYSYYNNFSKVIVGLHHFYKVYNSENIHNYYHINLDGWGLNKIPETISDFDWIRSVSLNHNQLKKVPKELANLKSLEYLKLGYNQIKNISDSDLNILAELSNLKEINFSHNYLSSLPKKIGDRLSHLPLDTIAFDCNEISHFPRSLVNLKSLKYLYLRRNKIKKVPSKIKKMNFKTFITPF